MTRRLDSRLAELRAMARTQAWSGRGVGDVALERVAEEPGRVIVIDGHRRITRGELLEAARRLGGALAAHGVARGAAIAFQLPNWWEACAINLACALFGYRVVPLLTIYREAELTSMLAAAEVDALFIPTSFRKTDFPALIQRLSSPPRHVFVVRGDPGMTMSFERLLANAPADPSPSAADDLKMILFTSGSTSRPKGVLHSHNAFDALVRRTASFWTFGPDDVLYVPSPVGHIGGSIYAFEFPWTTGCAALLAESWAADSAVTAIDENGATFMAGATPFLTDLVAAAEKARSHLPSLRRFVCGGASVPPSLVRAALARFTNAVVSRAYGSTEVPLICPGIRSREEAEARAGTDGECTSDVRLLDDADQPVAEGLAGEVVVRSPQMFIGYLDPRDDEAAFTGDGYFRMGDLARRIEGRYLEITGRKKDLIIRKGENISPLEIENALRTHPAIEQVAVVGVPDALRGEAAWAFVLPKSGHGFTFAEMTAHLVTAGLARQKFPEFLRIVRSMPMNAVGKIQKNELKTMALSAPDGNAT
jgi:acyl-CoA synthetase (AMP-forming)/AMP-acid ligase II